MSIMNIISPRDGDKIFGVVNISGNSVQNAGINALLLTSSNLIGDGYTTTNSVGDFYLSILFRNQDPGTPIKLVMVYQTYQDSEEIVINLVQSRVPIGSISVRSGRKLIVDQNTVALWRLGKTPVVNIGAMEERNFNFITAGPTIAPTGMTRQSNHSAYYPRFQDGFMTVYDFSTPSMYSRVRMSPSGSALRFENGVVFRFAWRTSAGSPYSPSEGYQALLQFNTYYGDGRGVRISYNNSPTDFYLVYVDEWQRADSAISMDKYNWNHIELRAINLVYEDPDTCYVELYVNGYLYGSAFLTDTNVASEIYLGSIDSSGDFTTSDFNYLTNNLINPYMAFPGYNVQGNKSRDGLIRRGVAPVRDNSSDLPSDYATQLDGTSGYIDNNDSAFDLTGSFTVEGWFKIDTGAVGNEMVIFGKQARDTSGWCLRIGAEGRLWAYTYNGSANVVDTGTYPLEDTWYHTAFVWDSSEVRIYINGSLKVSQAVGYTANTTEPFRVGSYSDAVAALFKGRVFDIRVSDVARSPWEIYGVFNAVSDPTEGFAHDAFTMAALNFGNDDGILYAKSTRTKTFKSFDFTSDNVEKYFEITSFSGDGSASLVVLNGDATLRINHISGTDTDVTVSSQGRLRLTGDFDYKGSEQTTEAYICLVSTGCLHNIPGVSKRVVRQGPVFYDDDLGTTDKYILTDEDGYINFNQFISSETPSYTYDFPIDFGVTGYEYDRDGYLIYDVHGGMPLGAHYFRVSPIGRWARDFDGSTTTIKIADHQEWDHRDLSVEAWFSADILQDGCLVSRQQVGVDAHFYIKINSNATITCGISDDVGNSTTVTGGTYSVEVWHYVAMTFDNSDRKLALYLDGVLVKTSLIAEGGSTHISNLPVYIGSVNNDTDYFDGAIAAVRFSSIPRTPKQIFDAFHGSDVKEGR